jgi:TRAP-type C4-dicarboxylate transport system permease small subunit
MTSAPGTSSSPRWLDAIAKGLDYLIALALLLMVIMVFGNVVLRYAFNSGITASEELSRWLFVWLTFLGAIVALKEHDHLGTDMLTSRLPRAGKLVCMIVSLLLMLWMCWLIFQGSLEQAKINLGNEAPVTGWSMAIVYASGIVFSIGAGLLLLRELFRVVSGKARDDELVMTQESEDLAHVEAEVEGVTHEHTGTAEGGSSSASSPSKSGRS